MILQEIGAEIIGQIKSGMESILSAPVKGFGLGIKTAQNLVVSAEVSSNGERVPFGIEDNKGTYFYIRYDGKTLSRRLSRGEKIGSCNELMITAPMRLVFIHHCSDPQKLLLFVQNIFAGLELNSKKWTFGQKKVLIFEKGFNFIPWDIFNEETGKPKTEFVSNSIQIVSIDFEIRLNTNYKYCTLDKCD
jgi:hypothetical protein